MAKNLEEMAERHAAALGRAEAALTFIASIADQTELVRQTAREMLAEINRIIAGKGPQ
jgi:hypothetical protein